MVEYHRQSIRLDEYDYSSEGLYFVTITTNNRRPFFGTIADHQMHLNECGQIAHNEWLNTPNIRPNITLGAFIIMPDHMHGIIIINHSFHRRGVLHTPNEALHTPNEALHTPNEALHTPNEALHTPNLQSPSQTIGAIIRGYKSTVSRKLNYTKQPFKQQIWQRNYYEHIIRNEIEYYKIEQYINMNQSCWNDNFKKQ